MATFSKPTTILNWADDGTPGQRVDPGVSKRDSGWLLNDDVPFSELNFIDGNMADFIQWLDERLFDGVTDDDFKVTGVDVAAGGGGNLNIEGGDGGGTDQVGGTITVGGGSSTGDGGSQIEFQVARANQGAGATVRAPSTEAVLTDSGQFAIGPVSDTDFNFERVTSDDVRINWDTDDFISYTRGSDFWTFGIGGSAAMTLSGLPGTGNLFVQGTAPRISIGDTTFFIDNDGIGSLSMVWDPGDTMVFNRIANSWRIDIAGNTMITAVGSTDLESRGLRPLLNNTFKLGDDATSGPADRRWSEIWGELVYGTENLAVPSSQSDLVARHANNCVLACASILSSGSIAGGASDHWNIASVSHPATGQYDIVLDQAVDGVTAVVQVTPLSTAVRIPVHGFFTGGGTTVRVEIFNSSFALVDNNFSFSILGRPSTLPT